MSVATARESSRNTIFNVRPSRIAQWESRMGKVTAVILPSPDDLVRFQGEAPFWNAIRNDGDLQDRVDLKVADPGSNPSVLRDAEILIVARLSREVINAA